MLEAGVHFGHQTRRWNPKMKPYIFAEKNGIYIIDLQQTFDLAKVAYEAARKVAAAGSPVLFVGPKKQAQSAIREEAERCGQFFVIERWLGGLLTNYATVRKSLDRLDEIEAMDRDGRIEQFNKKERMSLDKKRLRLERMLGGIRGMDKQPGLIFVVDTKQSDIAIKEANKLKVPVIAIVDTNCDPDPVDYPIPGNDDAIRSIRLFSHMVADAILEGQAAMKDKAATERAKAEKAEAEAAAERPAARAAGRKPAAAAPAPTEPEAASGVQPDLDA
ncbi:MAG: 30S ribosomal protein S2 [Candidatus Krumholzibacteriota bacterium]|nr:30S ribosomal protein S2 [Candidatus Krumholzibacteriota bacterium]